MKQTKAAMKELAKIGDFIGGFKRAKKTEPEVIYLSKKQVDILGIEKSEKVLGKQWEQFG